MLAAILSLSLLTTGSTFAQDAPAPAAAEPAAESAAADDAAEEEEDKGPTPEEIAAAKKVFAPFEKAVHEAGDDYAFEGDSAEADALFDAAGVLIGAKNHAETDEAKQAVTISEEANAAFVGGVYSSTSGYSTFLINNLWLLIAAALVFIMHLGFSTLEVGLTQQKNTVNILFKNAFIIAIGIITYYLMGFNTHYPSAWIIEGVLAFGGPASVASTDLIANQTSLYADYSYWTDFIFQAMFAATAATIVSGAVAERVKLPSFMIFATVFVAIGYTVAGSWKWGGGWLDEMGFYDFAGSTVVHAFGGFGALACVILLGARRGKYTKNGTKPILGHNMPMASIGVFLLWFGWFGFNGGSVLNADGNLVSTVFVTTSLAAAAGVLSSIVTAWVALKKPDLSMALNGALAGLVGITAGADVISPGASILVGLIAGVLVVFAIVFFDKIKIDDPVGAISVHGICGIWGTLAVGLFTAKGFFVQLVGAVSVSLFAFVFAFIVFFILKKTLGVRVDEEEEVDGLDIAEHGSPAYADFQTHN